jgi:hypothetical protein
LPHLVAASNRCAIAAPGRRTWSPRPIAAPARRARLPRHRPS